VTASNRRRQLCHKICRSLPPPSELTEHLTEGPKTADDHTAVRRMGARAVTGSNLKLIQLGKWDAPGSVHEVILWEVTGGMPRSTESSKALLQLCCYCLVAPLRPVGGSPSWLFAFRMSPTVGFTPPDPRTVSIVSPVEVDYDLVSPLPVTVPRCWWARAG